MSFLFRIWEAYHPKLSRKQSVDLIHDDSELFSVFHNRAFSWCVFSCSSSVFYFVDMLITVSNFYISTHYFSQESQFRRFYYLLLRFRDYPGSRFFFRTYRSDCHSLSFIVPFNRVPFTTLFFNDWYTIPFMRYNLVIRVYISSFSELHVS